MKTSFTQLIRSTVLAAATVTAFSAQAYNPFGRGEKDSYALINKIPAGHGPLTTAETLVILLADPPVAEVSGLSTSLSYDTSKYTFRSDLSGLICEFAQGASCPPASAVYGTYMISDMPMIDLVVGQALPGGTLTVTNDIVAGVVSVDYVMSTPLLLDGQDRNFFAFVFESLQPYNPYATQVTFHDQPGSYDFTQLSASCISTERCGSNTPVYGITITPIPEPEVIWLSLAGLVVVAQQRRRRFHET
ncbi:MAG TPA: hypothetical protein VFW84_15345 [Aquabacterium sp.]|uniref:hypothetical protein n=1 Tax=Aquabacterium sp. TaxID=1872578 RepID=UPI002E30D602|nr:hypothetical protein [Aquabacterium sp.]HEX5374099.1 hypothetical protein [Aquabacterium sp.]